MKKAILKILMIIFGLNVFTSCYGVPPGEWPDPAQLPEEQKLSEIQAMPDEDPDPKESDETEDNQSLPK